MLVLVGNVWLKHISKGLAGCLGIMRPFSFMTIPLGFVLFEMDSEFESGLTPFITHLNLDTLPLQNNRIPRQDWPRQTGPHSFLRIWSCRNQEWVICKAKSYFLHILRQSSDKGEMSRAEMSY